MQIFSDERLTSLSIRQDAASPKETDMPDWWISPQWLTTLAILGLCPNTWLSGTPRVAYVGSPLLRLIEAILWMDDIRVKPGYYSGRQDSRYKPELLAELQNNYSNCHATTCLDYATYSSSSWNDLYNKALRLASEP
jgi:hypothetical protein